MPDAILPHHIDSTMMSAFRSCPRKFYLEFVLGLQPMRKSVHLHAGACFAQAIETVSKRVHLHADDLPRALELAHAEYLLNWGDFVPPEREAKQLDRVWEAVEEYFALWSPLTDSVQPYMSDGTPSFEFTFAIPLEPSINPLTDGGGYDAGSNEGFPCHPSGDPFFYCGRFDLLGNWQGIPVVRDEKTTGSIPHNWAEQWDLRSQFLGYTWACQQSGLPVDTTIVRGVGILKTKIDLVEAVKPYSRFLIDRWYEQLRRDLWRLRRAWDESYFDWNLGEACNSYGGCQYRTPCSSVHEESWYNSYRVRRWNPLEKNPLVEELAA